jgi:UDP-N-acetylmuramoyl-tripeptide--D-alanyl-D-alanine ligase
MKQPADFRLTNLSATADALACDITHNNEIFLRCSHQAVSGVQLYSVLAAVIVGNELGLTREQILDGITSITPVSGRLRRLRGIHDSLIIDDTYNALPDAVKAGLEMLHGLKAPQKIAILGTMNQLGAMSPQAHKEIGALCDPAQLDLVVTIGPDANEYLAPAAAAKGCTVKSFNTPYEAGEYVQSKVAQGAIIFAKGSQDKVYTEEAIKPLLADPKDVSKLVRQSAYWLKIKQKNFKGVAQS